eukprot:scaffold4998_cov120-Isochrysis_galbana.AAC.9
MADAASRGHAQAAAGAVGLASWRRRLLARPQAVQERLARQAERLPVPSFFSQGIATRNHVVLCGSSMTC